MVLEHLAKITAIEPAAAGRKADEVFDLVLRRIAKRLPMYLPRGITASP